jgi:hypothetical protein
MPYDERHIIGQVLLRNGRKVSVLFYGGRGGGKKQKSSIIELGFMLSIELSRTKENAEIYPAKEWNLIWNHNLIRSNHQAFYLMCFYLEVISKLAPLENLKDIHFENEEMAGLFNTLSNSLFNLEKNLNSKIDSSLDLGAHTLVFIAKLLLHLGVFPEREHCTLCEVDLNQFADMFLLFDEGGFACPNCLDKSLDIDKRNQKKAQSGRELWELLGHISHKKYSELIDLKIAHKEISKILFSYFSFQFSLDERQFKSYPMVF